ncbi:MAG: FAD-dependent thymidylate synthase [Ignavibacteria bacterium]|nr:FAD-dependent thymidylate synthase [Ignavibacteria bacterium]
MEIKSLKTKRDTNPQIEEILGKEFKILDHGFIRIIDYMGCDSSIVQAARVSYGTGTKKRTQDRNLIRYLMRHRHTTPFEMCEIKLHIKLPIFVARQWIRHRTANVNEYSARYSILDKEYYTPDSISEQSKNNNQGRGDEIIGIESKESIKLIDDFSALAYENYTSLINVDNDGVIIDVNKKSVAREIARMVLPTNYYTQWYWKIDLHNLLHFLSLRADSHAQYEIRVYAEKIAEIVKLWVPDTYEAFNDYVLNASLLSSHEVSLIKKLIRNEKIDKENSGLSEREWNEFSTKFNF